jgi:hypothetical protein
MVHYPEIQQKMRNEQEVVCGDSYPSLAHRLEYVYTYGEDKNNMNRIEYYFMFYSIVCPTLKPFWWKSWGCPTWLRWQSLTVRWTTHNFKDSSFLRWKLNLLFFIKFHYRNSLNYNQIWYFRDLWLASTSARLTKMTQHGKIPKVSCQNVTWIKTEIWLEMTPSFLLV